ncbi:MAG: hypothetical protein ACR2OV_15930 [Hyphomicrobiaceae bacterium]
MTEDQAVKRIERAIIRAERRQPFGDYDLLAQAAWNEIKAIALEGALHSGVTTHIFAKQALERHAADRARRLKPTA